MCSMRKHDQGVPQIQKRTVVKVNSDICVHIVREKDKSINRNSNYLLRSVILGENF